MALLPMALTLTQFKILHLEPTDACQAACPQCAREVDTTFDKTNIHHLTVDRINELFTEQQIKHLDKMFMCGDYGDPAAGKHTLEIFKYFRRVNPTITLGMNTNGGLRDSKWWRELAGIMTGEKDYVVFSIDGLEDTNHIYRINVDWSKVIDNVNTFITAGGNAQWDMLVFDHNKHQVDHCEARARKLGFNWFRAKVSRRHDFVPIDFLKRPNGWANPTVTEGHISCQALEEQSIYLSANGVSYPCCYLGTTSHTLDQFDSIQESWNTEPNETCKITCTKLNNGTSHSNQWQREIELI
jgi:MoaA/NifB/PqqE/SkfB family radical SAM enzyme